MSCGLIVSLWYLSGLVGCGLFILSCRAGGWPPPITVGMVAGVLLLSVAGPMTLFYSLGALLGCFSDVVLYRFGGKK